MDCNIIPLPYRSGVACSLARPAVVQQQHGGIRSAAVSFSFLILTIPFRSIISASAGPNFAKFADLAQLWL